MTDTYVPVRTIDAAKLPGSLRLFADVLNHAMFWIDYFYFGGAYAVSEGRNGRMTGMDDFTGWTRMTLNDVESWLLMEEAHIPPFTGGLDGENTSDELLPTLQQTEVQMLRQKHFLARLRARNVNPDHVRGLLSKAYRMGCFPPDVKLKPRIGFCIEVVHFMTPDEYRKERARRSVPRKRVA